MTFKDQRKAAGIAQINVNCGHCRGSGKVVHLRLTQAFRCLVRDEWRSTAWIAQALSISGTNAANLLKALHIAGMIERRGRGAGRSPFEWRQCEIINVEEIEREATQ